MPGLPWLASNVEDEIQISMNEEQTQFPVYVVRNDDGPLLSQDDSEGDPMYACVFPEEADAAAICKKALDAGVIKGKGIPRVVRGTLIVEV